MSQIDLDELARGMQPILEEHPEVAAAWVFGSAVRGELRFDSDVDVGILLGERGATAHQHYRLLAALAARIEALTSPHPVDVVLLEPQGPIFCHQALLEGRLVYDADHERRVDFVSDTLVHTFDFRPTHELAVKGQGEGILRRLKEPR
jgi:predicted nucleotidyltransferase